MLDIIAGTANGPSSEILWFKNIIDHDDDKDGLGSDLELALGTDPFDQDTDNDGLSDGEEVKSSRTDTRWLQGPNGNYYRLASADTWSNSSATARAQGHELTSIQDQTEAEWLSDTFGGIGDGFWIGLSDF